MMKCFLGVAVALALATATLAQQQPQQQPQQQGPKPKSQKELQALQQVQAATTPQARMTAIDNVLENFTDTEYKHILLDMAIQSAQQANDPAKVEFYGERALKDDPKDVTAQLALASSTIQNTKEFDLDKEQKLAKAEKYANDSLEALKTAPSPNPQMPDAQWQEAKKQMAAEAYADLGASAALKKKYDVALTNYKTAAENDPEPAILVRLASAYNEAKQPDNAITTCDRILAMNDAPPQVKQIAQQIKATAQKSKTIGAK
ncbi:MAG: tetratricopeptide repeat protein [Bryobacteraceae bacterium]